MQNSITSNGEVAVENKYLHITNKQLTKNIYSVYLTEHIGDSRHYRDLYNLLRQANHDDLFLFYMNNYGGLVHTGIEIINAMNASHASTISVLTGPVYSMAPLITLNADKVCVEPHSFMMFHDYSGGTRGKGHEQEAAIINDRPFFSELFSTITKKFLNTKEIRQVLQGKDLYLNRETIIDRLKKIGKLYDPKTQ